jgi:hypothetical protein
MRKKKKKMTVCPGLFFITLTQPPQTLKPAGRYAHCAVTYNNQMIVYGGRGYERNRRSSLVTFRNMPLTLPTECALCSIIYLLPPQ